MFSQRLLRARMAAGLSMQALGEQAGVSANAIKKYEHGEAMPSSKILLAISKALDVRMEYFFRTSQVKLENVEYRKRARTTKKTLNRITADILDQAERWHELLDLYPDSVNPVADFEIPKTLPKHIDDYAQIEATAENLRKKWRLGLNQIPDLIDTLESKGIMVINTSASDGNNFDGLAGNIGKTPVIVISDHSPGDRQRFTLAHELGHLMLKGRLKESIDEEKACNLFAGAFLLPKEKLIEHFGQHRRHIEVKELYLTKHEYGLSMLATMMRLAQCEIISENYLKQRFIYFNQKKWRTEEPGEPYPKEKTILFKQLVYRALAEDYISEAKAAELLATPLSQFHKDRKLESNSATDHQARTEFDTYRK